MSTPSIPAAASAQSLNSDSFNIDSATITICDSDGRVTWVSSSAKARKVGKVIWAFVAEQNLARFRATFETALAQGKSSGTFLDERGTAFVQMWSLGSPDSNVCMLTQFAPPELRQLSKREQDFFPLLAQGYNTEELASELKVSVSTLHSQLRKIREKLRLSDTNKLVCYATKYSHFIDAIPQDAKSA